MYKTDDEVISAQRQELDRLKAAICPVIHCEGGKPPSTETLVVLLTRAASVADSVMLEWCYLRLAALQKLVNEKPEKAR